VLLSHHLKLLQPYSAVEIDRTFFSSPSFIFTFFPPSLAKPGTGAANGDRISGPFLGQLIPTATQGVFYNMETAIITGGTGRFRHATGVFTLYGQVNFVARTFVLPWQGTISGVDSHRRD
jgi:hypothetical protein